MVYGVLMVSIVQRAMQFTLRSFSLPRAHTLSTITVEILERGQLPAMIMQLLELTMYTQTK
jgi:hypothetical protein